MLNTLESQKKKNNFEKMRVKAFIHETNNMFIKKIGLKTSINRFFCSRYVYNISTLHISCVKNVLDLKVMTSVTYL